MGTTLEAAKIHKIYMCILEQDKIQQPWYDEILEILFLCVWMWAMCGAWDMPK